MIKSCETKREVYDNTRVERNRQVKGNLNFVVTSTYVQVYISLKKRASNQETNSTLSG